MHNKQTIKPITLAIGTAFITGLAAIPAVQADTNPFSATALAGGYMVAEKATEGECGANKKAREAECGANKAGQKVNEAECGANKKATEGECGANKAQPKPVQEAKCGEAKCGNNQ